METIKDSQMVNELVTSSVSKDLLAGFIAGGVSIFVGYPLDTIKTRMQLSKKKLSTSSTIQKVYRKEGIHGMYKGVMSPVIGRAPASGVTFAVNDFCKKHMQNWNIGDVSKAMLSGIISGFASTPLNCPVELLKIKRQANEGKSISYSSIVRKQGVRGMFSGLNVMFFRDVPTVGIYFAAFTYLSQKFNKWSDSDQTRFKISPMMSTLFAGGFAGQISWI